MLIMGYVVGTVVTSVYTAYILKTNEVGWWDIAPSSVSTGSLWPITLPVIYIIRNALSDP